MLEAEMRISMGLVPSKAEWLMHILLILCCEEMMRDAFSFTIRECRAAEPRLSKHFIRLASLMPTMLISR